MTQTKLSNKFNFDDWYASGPGDYARNEKTGEIISLKEFKKRADLATLPFLIWFR